MKSPGRAGQSETSYVVCYAVSELIGLPFQGERCVGDVPRALPSANLELPLWGDPSWKTKAVDIWRKQNWVKLQFKTAREKQAHALPALRELGAAATVWTWVDILTNRLASPEVQNYAATTLASFGKDATAALTALLQMPDHPHPHTRSAIGHAIHYCDREGFLNALYNAGYATNANVRASGAWSLGHLAKNPDMSLPALARAMNDPSPHVRESAIEALAKFHVIGNRTTNLIMRALDDPERRVRRAATNALERIDQRGDANADNKAPEAL